MLGAPTLAALLLQLAVRSEALSAPQSLGPVDDGASHERGGKSELRVFDLDGDMAGEDAGGGAEGKVEDSSNHKFITDLVEQGEAEFEADAHQTLEASFVATLDMAKARRTGELVGMEFCVKDEQQPPYVCRVKPYGLTNDWNMKALSGGRMTPQILLGDEVVKVNDIAWHRNSDSFIRRVKSLFVKSRKQGVEDSFALTVQRRKQEVKKLNSHQLEQRHKYLYEREWTAKMNTTGFLANKAAERTKEAAEQAKVASKEAYERAKEVAWQREREILAKIRAKKDAERAKKNEDKQKAEQKQQDKQKAEQDEAERISANYWRKRKATQDIVSMGSVNDWHKGLIG